MTWSHTAVERQKVARNQILEAIKQLSEKRRSEISSYLEVLTRNAYIQGGIDADLESGRFR